MPILSAKKTAVKICELMKNHIKNYIKIMGLAAVPFGTAQAEDYEIKVTQEEKPDAMHFKIAIGEAGKEPYVADIVWSNNKEYPNPILQPNGFLREYLRRDLSDIRGAISGRVENDLLLNMGYWLKFYAPRLPVANFEHHLREFEESFGSKLSLSSCKESLIRSADLLEKVNFDGGMARDERNFKKGVRYPLKDIMNLYPSEGFKFQSPLGGHETWYSVSYVLPFKCGLRYDKRLIRFSLIRQSEKEYLLLVEGFCLRDTVRVFSDIPTLCRFPDSIVAICDHGMSAPLVKSCLRVFRLGYLDSTVYITNHANRWLREDLMLVEANRCVNGDLQKYHRHEWEYFLWLPKAIAKMIRASSRDNNGYVSLDSVVSLIRNAWIKRTLRSAKWDMERKRCKYHGRRRFGSGDEEFKFLVPTQDLSNVFTSEY